MTVARKRKSRRWIWIVGVVAVLAIGAFFVIRRGQQAVAELQGDDGERVTVSVGDLSSSASASGRIGAARQADLALATAGQVSEILVEEGESVSAGDPLIRLDAEALERAVESARQSVAIQEANLEQLMAGASVADVAASEAAVASAQAALNETINRPTEAQIAASEAQVRSAQANLDSANAGVAQLYDGGASQADVLSAQNNVAAAEEQQLAAQRAHEQTLQCTEFENGQVFCPSEEMELRARYAAVAANASLDAARAQLNALLAGPDANAVAAAQAGVASAQANLEAAQANLALTMVGATVAQIASAEAQLAQAEASLARLLDGATSSQVVAAESGVAQAQINLQRAENNLAKATLYAPFDGLVTAVNATVGEQAAGPVVSIVDTTQFEVILSVDELDVVTITVGQEATVTLDAFPDDEIVSEVISIAPKDSLTADSLVTYEVRVRLGETDRPVRLNMTANADMTTGERNNVLLVPNRAISVDRDRGTFNVTRLVVEGETETTEEVEVVVGLRDGQFTEIIDGVEEGDTLIIGTFIPRIEFGPPSDG